VAKHRKQPSKASQRLLGKKRIFSFGDLSWVNSHDVQMQSQKHLEKRSVHSFLTIARFDPDSWFTYGAFAATAIVLYAIGFAYLAVVPIVAILGIFGIEASEIIHLDYPDDREIVGVECYVIRQISKTEKGVVQLGKSEHQKWELWSAESEHSFEKGSLARVSAINGLTLQIEPLDQLEISAG
jgi:membrane protein implicated in regulation of membrane protease activity